MIIQYGGTQLEYQFFQEAEAGESESQGLTQLYGEFEANLAYIRYFLKAHM